MREDDKTKKQLEHELMELRSENAALKKSIAGNGSAALAAEEAGRYAESIVATVREPLLVLDADLKIISANRNFYRTFKVTPAETIGSFIYDLGNKQWDIPKLRELLEKILPEKEAFDDFEVDHYFRDIGHKIMLLNARRIVRKDIGSKMILLAIEDITERRQLESLLSESEERFRRLFETASDGIVLLEKSEGRITHANPASEKMLGYTKEESIGKMLQDIGVSLDIGNFQTTMQKLNNSGILHFDNVTIKSKLGQKIDSDIYLVDRAKLVQCNIRDITERKHEQDALRKSEEKFRILFDQAPDIILILEITSDGLPVILDANSATLRLLGYKRDELIGHPVSVIEAAPNASKVTHERRKNILSGKGAVFVAKRRCKDGAIRDFECLVTEIQIDSKTCAISVERDITERKALEAQFQQAQKMESVGRLAGGVAHDLNNLLTPILVSSELLLRDFSPQDFQRQSVEEIHQAGIRAKNLVRQLLAFSRKQPLEVKVLSLNEVLSTFEKLLRRTVREDVSIELNLAPSLPSILGDVGQIEQVIMNLAVNAQDAMPSGGKLTLETRAMDLDESYTKNHRDALPGRHVMLAVSDTGHGMDAKVRERIFEPFFTTKEKEKGTGLGLATVYGIVKQHGGNIYVYSEPGKGTSFKLYFPVSTKEEKAAQALMAIPGDTCGNETVMVVEDDDMVRSVAVRVLRSLGYNVLQTSNGAECLKALASHHGPLDLLLTDVVMPEMNGKELSKKVSRQFPGIKVLYMSGYTNNVIVHHGVLDSNISFIEKPFSVQRFVSKVQEVLNKK